MAERSGSVLPGRSIALPRGRALSAGPESPVSVKILSFPDRFSSRVKGNDSSVIFPLFPFRPLTDVQKTAITTSRTVEIPSNIVAFPDSKQPAVDLGTDISGFNNAENKISKKIILFPLPQVSEPEPVKRIQSSRIRHVPVVRLERSLTTHPTHLPPQEIIPQQVLLKRVLRSFSKIRNQVIGMVDSEAQAGVRLQNVPLVSAANEAALRQNIMHAEVLQRPITEVPNETRSPSGLARIRKLRINYVQEKAVVDEKTNKLRVNALIAARDRLKALGQEFSNEAVVRESGIAYLKDYRSPIVKEREDGTQPRTARALGMGELTNEKIAEDVAKHSALKKDKDGIAATAKQLYEVITHPERPFVPVTIEDLLPKKKIVQNVEAAQAITGSSVQASTAELNPLSEGVIENIVLEPVPVRNPDFVQSAIDRLVYIGSAFQLGVQTSEAEERAQLLAA